MNSSEASDVNSDPFKNGAIFPTQQIFSYKYDLHLVYLAFMDYFRVQKIPWEEFPWASYFTSFERFLSHSWRVITVTDKRTGKPHIVVTSGSIKAFRNKIRVMCPENYLAIPDIRSLLQLQLVDPFDRSKRNGVRISDYASYRGLVSTFPEIITSDFRGRVWQCDPNEIKNMWSKKDRTYLAMSFQRSDEDKEAYFGWGYAALCCSKLNGFEDWPPNPNTDYRKGNYIFAEHIEKAINTRDQKGLCDYAFGKSQIIPKESLCGIIRDTISNFSSAEIDSELNSLILVSHDCRYVLRQLKKMGIGIPHNVLVIDTALYEQSLFKAGYRGKMKECKTAKQLRADPEGIYVEPYRERDPGSLLSLGNLLLTLETHPILPFLPQADSQLNAVRDNPDSIQDGRTAPNVAPIGIPIVVPNFELGNSGNRSVLILFAFQAMVDPQGTEAPRIVVKTETGNMPNWTSML